MSLLLLYQVSFDASQPGHTGVVADYILCVCRTYYKVSCVRGERGDSGGHVLLSKPFHEVWSLWFA
jgi:hypothetical protein